MAKQRIKIQLADNIKRVAFIESGATAGATIGSDLLFADGTVVTLVNLAAALGVSDAAAQTAHQLLLGLTLGDDHPQYVRKDTLTAKGDMYVRNVAGAPGVPVRLPVGTTGTVLTAQNGTPTWAPPAPFPMFLAEDGAEGDRGPPGADGRAGAVGPAGPAIFLEGDAGEQGEMGPPGAAGVAGVTGAMGPAGPAIWLEAEQGEQGDPGQPGGAGPPGSTGPAGVPGPAVYLDADAGEDAMFGPQGNPGATGLTGAQGPTGVMPFLEDGLPGDDGAPGAPGATGLTGAQGPLGPVVFFLAEDGQEGDRGVEGARGVQGITGAQGPAGVALFIEADAGDEGATGAPGSPGATGLTGAQGPAGPALEFLNDDPLYPTDPDTLPAGKTPAMTDSGTFTPVFSGTTVAGTPTYSLQTGFYSKVGDVVFFIANVILTGLGGATGNAQIGGLPFTAAAGVNWFCNCQWGAITFAANYTTVTPVVIGGGTIIALQKSGGAAVNATLLTIAELAATSRVIVTGFFRV